MHVNILSLIEGSIQKLHSQWCSFFETGVWVLQRMAPCLVHSGGAAAFMPTASMPESGLGPLMTFPVEKGHCPNRGNVFLERFLFVDPKFWWLPCI